MRLLPVRSINATGIRPQLSPDTVRECEFTPARGPCRLVSSQNLVMLALPTRWRQRLSLFTTKGNAVIIRKTLISACAVAAVLTMGACSSDDNKDSTAASSTSAAASSTTAKASASATTSAAAAAAAPTAEELNASLVALIDPAKPIEEKTALVVDGTKRQANIETMSAALGGNPAYAITFNVDNVKVDGQTATADVAVVSPHGAAPATPWTWELEDGSWKLSDTSACGLLEMGRASCTA